MLRSTVYASVFFFFQAEDGIRHLLVTGVQTCALPISEFILGKTLPFALIGFVDVALVTGIATHWFAVPIRGSLLLLAGATSLYLMSTLGIGLLISTISRTQQQAMMSAFFYYFQ